MERWEDEKKCRMQSAECGMKKKPFIICIVCLLCGILCFLFFDEVIAPLLFDSYVERINETGLPRGTIENGYVYCRMKAADFRLPLPAGCHATNLVITQGGFDWVDGSVQILFDKSAGFGSGLQNRLPEGGSAEVEFTTNGSMYLKFHYFGDK